MSSETNNETKIVERKPTNIFLRFFDLFKYKPVRIIVVLLWLLFSVAVMLCIDKDNVIRDKWFPFLSGNFIMQLMAKLGIQQVNIAIGGWILFFCLFGLILLLVIGGFALRPIRSKILKPREPGSEEEKKARRLFNFLYFFIIVMIVAIAIFVIYLCGLFRYLRVNSTPLFISFPVAALVFVIALALFFVCAVILYYVFKLLDWIIGLLFFIFATIGKDIHKFYKKIKEAYKRLKYRLKKGEELPEEEKKKEDQNAQGNGAGGIGEDSVLKVDNDFTKVRDGREIFPSLTRIDEKYIERETVVSSDVSLEEFVLQFQSYAINKHKIYYELPILRSFVAGLATSRLIILEGLSGTGKSMLPRMFSAFTGCKSFFSPVQSTWRDKSDLLGYYSEFTKSFKTSDFLQNLYEASYTDRINVMVLDEMNISRIEYYFADFLSTLEYPPEAWNVRVFEPELNQELPDKLAGGFVKIPTNTWFIGTANTDDSTFTITDKVYDRAVVLDFNERFSPISSSYNSDPVSIDAERLTALFESAQADPKYNLDSEDLDKFLKICEFTKDAFDIRFGNRIMVQIEKFVPVYVAMGGTKEEALDFMFSRKILRKVIGMFDDFVKDELSALQKLLNSVYGKGVFKETEKLIANISKRLV